MRLSRAQVPCPSLCHRSEKGGGKDSRGRKKKKRARNACRSRRCPFSSVHRSRQGGEKKERGKGKKETPKRRRERKWNGSLPRHIEHLFATGKGGRGEKERKDVFGRKRIEAAPYSHDLSFPSVTDTYLFSRDTSPGGKKRGGREKRDAREGGEKGRDARRQDRAPLGGVLMP